MKRAVMLLLLIGVLASVEAVAQVRVGMLQGLADLATVEEEGSSLGWRVVSPFLYNLDPNVVTDVEEFYPKSDYDAAEALSAVCGYIDWVKKTGNRSVVIFYTTFDWKSSFDILADIDRVTVDGQPFEPGALPIAVEIRNRTIDYTDCTCGEEGFIIYAVPMSTAFLDALKSGSTFQFRIRGWKSTPGNAGRSNVASVFTITRSTGLDDYIRLLNGMVK